jgi:uncharacterized cupin superfamily protein
MPTVNADDLDWTTRGEGDTEMQRKQLGAAAGGEDIGCSLYRLPAGNKAWPYHYHTRNEEALYVLSGGGSIRLDGELLPLTEDDYVAMPADERGAHRVINDGDEPLVYLMVSTMDEPEVNVYPDSDRIGVFVGSPPGGDGERTVEGFYDRDATVPYWDEKK